MSPEQAKRRFRRLPAVPIGGGQGQDRTCRPYAACVDSQPPDAVPLVARLRLLRTRLGLSQEQLARRLGVSFATVNRWESGRSRPLARARLAIAELEAAATCREPPGDREPGRGREPERGPEPTEDRPGQAADRAIQLRRARARAGRPIRAAHAVAADQPDRARRGRQDPAGHRGRAALGSEGRPQRRRGVRVARSDPAAPAGGLGARLAPGPARTARRVLARVGAGRTQGTARAAAARRRRTLPRGGGRAGRGLPRLGPGPVHRGHQPGRARGAGRGVLGRPSA